MATKGSRKSGSTPARGLAFDIPFQPGKPIHCEAIEHMNPKSTKPTAGLKPTLIFTHGAGGDLKSHAIANFAKGFGERHSILCFKGSQNLKSRVSMFEKVIEKYDAPQCLGGRSMGARAAVMAATERTTHLVLASYPLQSGKQFRDQILLGLPEHIKVLFVSGDNDAMCDLDRLDGVRRQMKCQSWRIVVKGADHGMNFRPKSRTDEGGIQVGKIVADWIELQNRAHREGQVSDDPDTGTVVWSGWHDHQSLQEPSSHSNGPENPLKNGHPMPTLEGQGTSEPPPKRRRR